MSSPQLLFSFGLSLLIFTSFLESLRSEEIILQPLVPLVHASQNIIERSNGTLETYPLESQDDRLIVTYDFSAGGQNSPSAANYSPHGYRGSGLVLSSGLPPHEVPVPKFFLSENERTAGWRVDLYFYPHSFHAESTLFLSERLAWENNQSQPYMERWKVSLSYGIPDVSMENLFHLAGARNNALHIRGLDTATLQQWNHLSIRYHAASGELQLFLNGRFAGASSTAPSRKNLRTLGLYTFRMAPSLQNYEPSFRIGEGFEGAIDEFSFYRLLPQTMRMPVRVPSRTASFSSTWNTFVFSLAPYTHVKTVALLGDQLDPETVQVTLCTSMDYFSELAKPPTATAIAFTTVSIDAPPTIVNPYPAPITCTKGYLNTDLKIPEQGTYYQLFFTLKNYTYPTARINAIALAYELDEPPRTPTITKIIPFQQAVNIQFQVDPDPDIQGYLLTYQEEGRDNGPPQKVLLPLVKLKDLQRHPYFYHFLLKGLSPQAFHTLTLAAYDLPRSSLDNPEERLSREPAQVAFRTLPIAANTTTSFNVPEE